MITVKECLETGCANCKGCKVGPTTSVFNEECYLYSTLEKHKKHKLSDSNILSLPINIKMYKDGGRIWCLVDVGGK